MNNITGSCFFIVTDPDQEKQCLYKVVKTANISSTLLQLNSARAFKDFKIVKFFQCSDLKKAEEFIKSALKKKFIQSSVEWIKLDDKGLDKTINTIEALIDIVNDNE